MAAIAWGVVAATAPGAPKPQAPPDRLLNASKQPIVAIEVVEVATGRSVPVAGEQLRSLAADLTPLLAVRSLPRIRPEYGLAQPFARLEAHTARGPLPAILFGGQNFDATGYYVRIEGRPGAALVLMRIGDTAKAVLAAAS